MEVVLQGYKRAIYQHRVSGSAKGHSYGQVSPDAISVFPVKKHNLTLNGSFDGHFSLTIHDAQKVLNDAVDRTSGDRLLGVISTCLEKLLEKAKDDEEILDYREDCLVLTAQSSLRTASDMIRRRLEQSDDE